MSQLSLAGVLASFGLLMLAGYFAYRGFNANERADVLVTHTYEVKDIISDASRDVERAEAARRGYLLDPRPSRVATYRESIAGLNPAIERLDRLTVDSIPQQRRIDVLRPILRAHLDDLAESMQLAQNGQVEEAIRRFDMKASLQRMNRIRAIADDIEHAEDELLEVRLIEEKRTLNELQLLLGAVVVALIVTGATTFIILRRNSKELVASQTNLAQMNVGLEAAVAERTADLRRANDEIQRFAYIVSHDLRSPLVNVMGFTAELEAADKEISKFVDEMVATQPDLVPKSVELAAKEDLPEALNFIRSSTRKMDRLINAILDLSRQGRRVLTSDKLDMDALISGVADSLSALCDARNAEISIQSPLPILNHDRLAVEQIFSNLLENAVKYLRPGVPGHIVVRGIAAKGRAIFEVEDNGRGINPSDHERIFELFRRSGAQDQQGEGIGLANIRALAYRLGGTINVRSTLDEGSTFTVDLPTEFVAEEKEEG